MKHEITWDEANGCVRLKLVGEFAVDEAKFVTDRMEVLFADRKPRLFIVDHTLSPDPVGAETRALLERRAVDLRIDRFAFFGMTNLNRMIARIIMSVAGRSETTWFFKTEAEALAWLRADP